MGMMAGFFLLFTCLAGLRVGSADTDPQDNAALLALMNQWQQLPSWVPSNDPCTTWDGVMCSQNRVTKLSLSTMGIKGTLSGDIGELTALQSLDLSSNSELGGPLPRSIGKLKNLTILVLASCSFSGAIPQELGNLSKLTFLALNSNKFTGTIPASLGLLSKVYWLDLGDNQLNGQLPISNSSAPGLDLLVKTKHFHFNKNQLSGQIPEGLFSSQMILIHILFDSNRFTGPIPASVGLVQSLEILRLDNNSLTGPVPTSISNLTRLNGLNLANNKLTGPMPNLTGMDSLNYVDLSNNTFDPSETPAWFSTLTSLTTLVIESGGLSGQIPKILFSFPQLQQVNLDNNKFNGTLDMGNNISKQLQSVDLQNNEISSFTVTSSYKNTLTLSGNPVCNSPLATTVYCPQQPQPLTPYSTSLANCGSKSCPTGQSLRPPSCNCAYAYRGSIVFRAPLFSEFTNSTPFQRLEMDLWRLLNLPSSPLNLPPGSVHLSNPYFNNYNYLVLQVEIFPSTGTSFNWTEVQTIGYILSFQIHQAPPEYETPPEFGPFSMLASQYRSHGEGKNSMSRAVIIGIAASCVFLVVAVSALAIYAFREKRKAEEALQLTRPFASWGSGGSDNGDAPQLKGARYFSFDELRKCTNNFSKENEIGAGGYGKVYRGLLPNGQVVAIKRAQQGSLQGAHEFKTEIELLSRVHHKNLVGLVGFCYEQGEQMLVYEFVSNGTLRENLNGRGGVQLDWKRRLRIALGSARGLAYLHELADPPIIHRDIKPTNILLDESLNAKVADFGLSKIVADSQKGHVSTQVKGTLGYLDPEYYLTQELSEKSDVYSFGVVMLELITARKPIEKGMYIVREVGMAIDRNDEEFYGLKDIMDPVIKKTTHLIGFRRFAELAMQCVEEPASNRPTMNQLVKEMEMILQDDELDTTSSSRSSTAIDFGKGPPRHPYSNQFSRKDESSNIYDSSGGYSYFGKVEPK